MQDLPGLVIFSLGYFNKRLHVVHLHTVNSAVCIHTELCYKIMLKSPFFFLFSYFRGIYLGKIAALGRGNSSSIAAAAFLCKASLLVKGYDEFCRKMLRMRCGQP